MTRIIHDVEPASPWLWMAILTKETNVSVKMDITEQGNVLKKVASYTALATSVATGDFSGLLWSSLGTFGDDMVFSSLAQSIQLPSIGYAIRYNDLGFIQYPAVDKILSEPIPIDFMETPDRVVSKYFNSWVNDISPIHVRLNALAGSVNTDRKGTLFHPLGSGVTRALYVIKMRRDVALSLVNGMLDAFSSGVLSNMANLRTGIYELPVQIYCYPRVFPQKITESKLDHSETNSGCSVNVILERVPRLILPGKTGPDEDKVSALLSVIMGYSGAVSAMTDTLIGVVNLGNTVVGKVDQVTKLFTKEEASSLTNLSMQPEQVDSETA